MKSFETIGLVGRLGNAQVVESVIATEKFLSDRGINLVVEERTAPMLPGCRHEIRPRAELAGLCQLILVVGGDGSLLGVARDFAQAKIPVLGINRGGLGFLADISPDHLEQQLGEVLDGLYVVEEHFLLQVNVIRGGQEIGSSNALNDVVLHAGTMSRMMEFAFYIDDEFVYDQRSDGLIVSSPTGSTAYALSAGGPIMHPSLDAIVIVPMFPHTLTSRPLVVQGDCVIKVVVGDCATPEPQVSCDSQVDLPVAPDDEVIIRKYRHSLPLVYPTEHSFYRACRQKLDWASRLGGRSS